MTKKKTLELKNRVSKIEKNKTKQKPQHKSGLDTTEGIISDLEDRSLEIMSTEV